MYQPVSDEHGHHEKHIRARRHYHGIHWRTPAIMVSSFLAGGLFILGHHLFYNSLHHKATSNALLQQQVNTGIGTAFAFIVKMFLVISVGTSYWQIFWLQIRKRPVLVERVDVLTGILEDATEFLSLKTMGDFPLLGIVAAITWLLPLAAIVPPAALTIELSPTLVDTVERMPIPVLNFSSGEYAQIEQTGSNAGHGKAYAGPQFDVQRVATGTAFSGRLSDFGYSGNQSFVSTFRGPALQCRDLDAGLRDAFTKNVSDIIGCDITLTWPSRSDGPRACYIQPMYMAWAPNETNTVAFSGVTDRNISRSWSGNTIGPDLGGDGVAQFYVASQPNVEGGGAWSFVGCELHNATYTINATYSDGSQQINVTKLDFAETLSYDDLFALVGTASDNVTDPLEGVLASMYSSLEQFAYQTLMDMFGRLLGGQIAVFKNNAIGDFQFSIKSTSILQTELVYTEELRPIFDIGQICSSGAYNCAGTETTNESLNITSGPQDKGRLAQALEQLFQNMTLSLFSQNKFRTDFDKSPIVEVVVRSPQNRYVYTSWRLLVPYLIGLGISAIGLACGFWALLSNNASYNQSFSTLLRTTRNAKMDTTMQMSDLTGTDPTPEHVSKARIDFQMVDEVHETDPIELKYRPR